mgnify:CR=1 FL=1
MENEKRGPGRPARPNPIEMIDSNLDDLGFVATAEASKPTAKARGIREANLRAEEIRNRLRQNEGVHEFHDDFYIDPRDIPDGWDYNWKRHTTGGMPDPAYEVELLQNGWEAVDASRHPHMMPPGYRGPIERKGMILMERPKEISDLAKQRELVNAREAVAAKERALGMAPSGHFERDKRQTGINKSYQPMEIPRN